MGLHYLLLFGFRAAYNHVSRRVVDEDFIHREHTPVRAGRSKVSGFIKPSKTINRGSAAHLIIE
jgi:hypothetical protein